MKPLLLSLFTLGIVFLSSPSFTSAQSQIPDSQADPTITAEGVIAPGGGFVPCSGITCDLCDFMIMANTIIKWLFAMAFLFFAVIAVKAGVGLVTSGGNSGAKQAAKQAFQDAFIGLIIFLCAWLLVDTLLRAILNKGDTGEIEGWGPWSQVKCATQAQSQIKEGFFEGDPIFQPYEGDNELSGASTAHSGGGTSVTPVGRSGMVSLTSLGVNVAKWNGTTGPGRTEVVHPTVAQAVLQMQNQGKAANGGKLPFQVTAAYTNNVGHSANSQHYKGTAVDLQPINGASYNLLIQLCKQAGFTFVNDERSARHIHCDMR